jgi:hypothetical protein
MYLIGYLSSWARVMISPEWSHNITEGTGIREENRTKEIYAPVK